MKKALILLLSLIVAVGLVACDEVDTEEKEVGSVESSDKAGNNNNEPENNDSNGDNGNSESNENDAEGNQESETSTYDEVLLDDDIALVTLKSIETVQDDIFGDEHKVKMEIENKSDKTIVVQANEVSIDGLMVDDMVAFSETVAGGKRANASLDIMSFDEELPELNENLELILIVLDEETFDRISETDVNIDLK